MRKINGCLKCVFIFFNALYAILGCVLIYAAIKSSIDSAQLSEFGSPSLYWILGFAVCMFGFSCLGIYAVCSEKVLFLQIFLGCMCAGMVIMLIFGTVLVVQRKQTKNRIDNANLQNEELRVQLNALQEVFQCCGISGASDWGRDIPQSCECNKTNESSPPSAQCIDKPQGTTGPNKLWAQGCKDILWSLLDIFLFIPIVGCFGFAATALLGLLISLLMIHQVNRRDGLERLTAAMKG